jgi:molecular chaperone HtpG
MAPYRSRREEAQPVAPTTGLVADMVRQFADPYAFFRELVQNGIDAGATRIEVSIEKLPEGLVATSVTDDGCGMTRETIEGPLLTLFSSSKEGDSSKIGKYGVGFVSIFALDPEEVQVATGRDGESWLLRLFRDHSYALEVGGPRTASGTRVTLLTKLKDKPTPADFSSMNEEEILRIARLAIEVDIARKADPEAEDAGGKSGFDEHVALSEVALRAWCRHAQVPISLTVSDPDNPDVRTSKRVDTPLSVLSPLSVVETIEGETFVVGVSAGSDLLEGELEPRPFAERGESFAGFYNRGLTLFESDQAPSSVLRGIRFKIMSPHLQHTLSRDNVRRDGAFDRVMAKLAEVIGALKKRLESEIASAAELASKGEAEARYAALLEAAQTWSLGMNPRAISFPLTDPLPMSRERVVRNFADHVGRGESLLTAPGSDRLTQAVAREGRVVVRCPNGWVEKALKWCSKYPLEAAHNVYVLVHELGPDARTASDIALCDEIRGMLETAGEVVARVGLCSLEGASSEMFALVVPDEALEGPRLYPLESVRRWWKRWTRRRVLLLNVHSDPMQAALKRAASDRVVSAYLVARTLLLRDGKGIEAGANERLLERAGRALA